MLKIDERQLNFSFLGESVRINKDEVEILKNNVNLIKLQQNKKEFIHTL